jgi:hypothetical protein
MPVKVPSWREVHRVIPPDFRDNGVSSPLQAFYGLFYWGRKRRADLARVARGHDFGYGPARLPGSPFEDITREGWDSMYSDHLIELDHPIIERIHRPTLDIAGERAWIKSMRKMHKWGWHTYDDFLRDTDKTYQPAPGGGVK